MRRNFVSVIVPMFNAERTIRASLESILNQSYPSYEIIVVNNNSTDHSKKIVEESHVRIVSETKQGSFYARNTGVKASSGDILVFMDADCIVRPDWLEKITHPIREEGEACVVARTEYVGGYALSKIEQEAYDAFINTVCDSDYILGADTKCLAVKRSVFEEVGGFDGSIIWGADWDFGLRLIRHGYRVRFLKDCEVRHYPVESLANAARRKYQNGRYSSLLYEKHRHYAKEYNKLIMEVKRGIVLLLIAVALFFFNPLIATLPLLLAAYYLKLIPFSLLYHLASHKPSYSRVYTDTYNWLCALSWKAGILRFLTFDRTSKAIRRSFTRS